METLSKVVQEPPAPYERAGPLVPALDAMLEKDPVKRARPVDARRALLDVLRGGTEAEAPVRSVPAAPARRRPRADAAAGGSGAGGTVGGLDPGWPTCWCRCGGRAGPRRRSPPPGRLGESAGAAADEPAAAKPQPAPSGPTASSAPGGLVDRRAGDQQRGAGSPIDRQARRPADR